MGCNKRTAVCIEGKKKKPFSLRRKGRKVLQEGYHQIREKSQIRREGDNS